MAEVSDLIGYIAKVSPPATFDPSKTGQFAVVEGDQRVTSLEGYQAAPNRITAERLFYDTGSLAEYVTRFGTPETVVVADWKSAKVAALIDYHGPQAPSHVAHRAAFKAEFSATYGAWREADRKWKRQRDLGEFLEERCRDVAQPAPADVMQMVMDFEVDRSVTFKQVTRLENGTRQAVYVENDQTKGMVQFRDELVIQSPVYLGMPAQNILVRLRYRIESGQLQFMLRIDQREILEQEAFEKCVQAVQRGIPDTVPIYSGEI